MPGLRSVRHWLSAPASWLRWPGDGRDRSCRPERRRRPRLEALEDRTLPAVLTVLNTLDSGAGSLRGEIAAAAGGDTIVFDPGLNGQTITLTSGQLDITKDLTISGPGAGSLTVARSSAAGTPDFGIFFVDFHKTVALSGLTISNGKAAFQGGGIFNVGTLSLSASILSGNSSGDEGGGIDNAGTLAVDNCVLSANAAVTGGGIYNEGTLTVRTCTLSGNTASTRGGGLANRGGTATVFGTTVSGNTADAGGGAILNQGPIVNQSSLELTNCTVSGNTTNQPSFPGVILNLAFQGTANLTLTSCTVAGNTGVALENIGGGQGSAHTEYRDTIFAKSTSTANVFNAGGGPSSTLTSLGHNLSDDSTGNLFVFGDQPNTDPLLGPLADNGGPTKTMALLPGSPALDAGDSTGAPAFDQRGFARVVNGAIDLGAFEDQLVVTSPSANPQGGVAGISGPLDLGSFSDLAPAGSWAVTVDWGDTSADTFTTSQQGPLGTKAHTYAQAGGYAVTVTVADSLGDGNRATFQVNVNASAPPAVTQQPVSQTVSAGQRATFTAAATANPAATVQWQVSTDGGKTFADIPGATSTTLSFTAAAPQNGNQYRAVFTNALGSAASAAATLGVRVIPAFGNLSSPTIIFGTASVTLSGTVAAGSLFPAGQVVSVKVNGVTRSATVRADGSFAATFATQALAAGSYAVSYRFAGGGLFLPAAGGGTLTVSYTAAVVTPPVPTTRHGNPLLLLLRVSDAAGRSAGSAGLAVTAVGLAPAATPSALQPARPSWGRARGNELLFFSGVYLYLLDTAGLGPGQYLFFFTVQGDPLQHSVLFQLT
jgi:hypothetical protein